MEEIADSLDIWEMKRKKFGLKLAIMDCRKLK